MTDKAKHLTQNPREWQEGFNAGRRGLLRKNPYELGTDEALA